LPDGLVAQLSFYFSESNLRRDRFLLKLTGEEGTGPVPLATLAKFNRVSALASDMTTIVAALRQIDWLVLDDQEESVRRREPLPKIDTSAARSVYVENLQAGASIESLRALFAPCGAVACVSLPRCASRDALGFAFVEFEREEDAAAAVHKMDGTPPSEGVAPLRVLLKATWESQKRAYKGSRAAINRRAAEQARREAAARRAADEAAADLPRLVVAISGIPRGANVKTVRREMTSVFGSVAAVDYVDYGISNSGNPSVAFVRMKDEVGAAEVVRVLTERKQEFNGGVPNFELLKGAKLVEYIQVITELRSISGKTKLRKRAEWWERKWGSQKAKAAEDAGAPASSDVRRAAEVATGADEQDSKRMRLTEEDGEESAKRQQVANS